MRHSSILRCHLDGVSSACHSSRLPRMICNCSSLAGAPIDRRLRRPADLSGPGVLLSPARAITRLPPPVLCDGSRPVSTLFLYPALPLESANAMCANISASTAPEHLFSKPAHRLRDGFLRCMSTIRRATLRFMGNWSMGQACLLTLFLRLVRAQPFDLHACPSPLLARAPRGICARGKSC